ncbi:hypothetical protein MKX01_028750 [Papaver californicum]|nr:hypothetical protein MKX01_028750 [Papaver californicum]
MHKELIKFYDSFFLFIIQVSFLYAAQRLHIVKLFVQTQLCCSFTRRFSCGSCCS